LNCSEERPVEFFLGLRKFTVSMVLEDGRDPDQVQLECAEQERE
jgi:hypothetical protein